MIDLINWAYHVVLTVVCIYIQATWCYSILVCTFPWYIIESKGDWCAIHSVNKTQQMLLYEATETSDNQQFMEVKSVFPLLF